MGRTLTTTWTCDLCGRHGRTTKDDAPTSWVTFFVEDIHQEREFHDKVVCNACVGKVTRAAATGANSSWLGGGE